MKVKRKKTRNIQVVYLLPPAVAVSGTQRTELCQTADGVQHRGPSGLYIAARHLIATGASPKDLLEVRRDAQIVLTGSVETFASREWGGKDRDPYGRKWRPDPWSTMPPALAAWWQGFKE